METHVTYRGPFPEVYDQNLRSSSSAAANKVCFPVHLDVKQALLSTDVEGKLCLSKNRPQSIHIEIEDE